MDGNGAAIDVDVGYLGLPIVPGLHGGTGRRVPLNAFQRSITLHLGHKYAPASPSAKPLNLLVGGGLSN